MVVRTKDGELLRIRAIRPQDKGPLAQSHARLSPETVRRRYLSPKPRLNGSELRYLTEVDGWDHVALVATPLEAPEDIVAVGRFVRLVDEPDVAEFAIVVADPWQGRGLGTLVAEALVARALVRGIRRFTATTLEDNFAVRRLIAHISRRLEHTSAGATSTLVAELAAA